MPRNTDRPVSSDTPESNYPLQTVYNTTGGHRVIIGNEKDKEAISIFHAKGTNIQIYPDGMISILTPGEYRQHSKAQVVSVEGNSDTHIKGHNKTTVGGGTHIEVAGDVSMVVGGSITMVSPDGDFNIRSKNMLFSAAENVNFNVGGNFLADVKGSATMMSDGNGAVLTNAALSLKASGRTAIKGSEIHHNNGSDQGASGEITAKRSAQV